MVLELRNDSMILSWSREKLFSELHHRASMIHEREAKHVSESSSVDSTPITCVVTENYSLGCILMWNGGLHYADIEDFFTIVSYRYIGSMARFILTF